MPKHNIDLIARVAYEARRAYYIGSVGVVATTPPPKTWDELAEEDQRAVRSDVLEAIHGDKLVDAAFEQAGEHAGRQNRLFAGIIKALTVVMRPAVDES